MGSGLGLQFSPVGSSIAVPELHLNALSIACLYMGYEAMIEELREIYESLTDMAHPSNTLLAATEFSAFDYVYCTLVIVLSLLFTWKMRQRPALCALAPLAANVAMAFVIKANFGTASVFDVVFGSLATAVGARFTWKFRDRPVVAAAGPVISNALIISAYLPLMPQSADFYVIPFTHISPVGSYALMFLFGVVSIGLGEAIVMYALGLPLAHALRRTRLVRFLTQPHE